IRPVPRQSRHGSENANAPWLRLTRPTPPHVGQVRGVLPGRAPVPPQRSQRPGEVSRSCTSAPRTASTQSIRSALSTSAPRRLRVVAVVPAPRPPNRPPNRSPSPLAPEAPPNRSFRSKPGPAAVPNPPGNPPPANRPPPPAKSARVSSYSRRFFSSDSTPYASETLLNRASASASPGLASGCSSRASLRYAFLISSAEASGGTP